MKKISTEVEINAPKNVVWSELMNHELYGEWNPFIHSVTGSSKVGEELTVSIKQDDKKDMIFKPEVLAHTPEREFRWKGKLFIKGLFDGEHYFILEQVNENKTRFIHAEEFTGIMVAPLLKMIGETTVKGFESMNNALKLRCESRMKITV